MLLSKSYDIEKILDLRFVHDDGSINAAKLHVGDVATVIFNNNGMRDEITGKISRIEAGTHYEIPKPQHVCQPGLVDSCNKNTWYVIVDGSMYNDSNMRKIFVDKIIGCEILKRNDSVTAVNSPLGKSNITDIRVNGNVFELSMDNQNTWIQVCKIPETLIEVDPELQDVVDKIAASIPGCVSPADKEKMIRQILATMEEEGQIIIHHGDDCGCDLPEEPPKDSVPSTPLTPPQLNIEAIVAAVIESIKEQGLVGSDTTEGGTTPNPGDDPGTTEPTPPSTDDTTGEEVEP